MWILQGWSLSRRVRYLEERWAYFFAFGSLSSKFVNHLPSNAFLDRLSVRSNMHVWEFSCECSVVRALIPCSEHIIVRRGSYLIDRPSISSWPSMHAQFLWTLTAHHPPQTQAISFVIPRLSYPSGCQYLQSSYG